MNLRPAYKRIGVCFIPSLLARGCLILICLALHSFSSWAASPPLFIRHKIANYPGGYQVAIADVNGDGLPDVIALSTDENRVDWFENPSWRPRRLAAIPRPMDVAPYDLLGNGKCEVAAASGFYWNHPSDGGEVRVFESQATNGTNLWTSILLGREPVAHRVRWANLAGDGRRQLVQAPILGAASKYEASGPRAFNGLVEIAPSHLWAYQVPKDFHEMPWPVWEIDNSLKLLHGIHVCDLDASGRDSVLTASLEGIYRFDLAPGSAGTRWLKTQIAKGEQRGPDAPSGASEVVAGRLANHHRFIASIEPWHGELVVVYTPSSKGGLWERTVIDSSLKEGHALVAADFSRDGQDEIVVGWRGTVAGVRGGIALYRALDATGQRWEKHVVDENIEVECLAVADLNGDSRLDLVANSGRRSNLLVWYDQQK